MYVCMYVCMYVYMYICMHECMYVLYMYIPFHLPSGKESNLRAADLGSIPAFSVDVLPGEIIPAT